MAQARIPTDLPYRFQTTPPSVPRSSNGPSSSPRVEPTYTQGIIFNSLDALVVMQACLDGQLRHVSRRPSDKEREDLIASGHIFCYEETASGIKRWTDGMHWSPSRILANCLVYRQLTNAFPPGEKKKANKKVKGKNGPNGGVAGARGYNSQGGSRSTVGEAISARIAMQTLDEVPHDAHDNHRRHFIGSLMDSYPFKEQNGLVKKTMSFTYRNVTHHVVSYYTLEDAESGRLMQPSLDPQFANIQITPELVQGATLRIPLETEMPGLLTGDYGRQLAPYLVQADPARFILGAPHPGMPVQPHIHGYTHHAPNGYYQADPAPYIATPYLNHQTQQPYRMSNPHAATQQQYINDPQQAEYPLNDPARPHHQPHFSVGDRSQFQGSNVFGNAGFTSLNGLPSAALEDDERYDSNPGDLNMGAAGW